MYLFSIYIIDYMNYIEEYMFSKAINITFGNFENEVLQSDIPVLLIFSAEWCSTCKIMESIVAPAMKDFENKIKFAVIDIDNERELTDKYGVLSVPTFMLLNGGRISDKAIGAMPRLQFAAFLTGCEAGTDCAGTAS